MLLHINMVEVPGTSVEANDNPAVAQFTRLLAQRTAPVFEAEPTAEKHVFSEVVAVTYRDNNGKPVHGGLFGVNAEGVVSLALKDLDGQVDTNKDPAHVAFGLLMMRGPLVFRQNGMDQKMEYSIIDIQADKHEEPLAGATPARETVKSAYLAEVLPHTGLMQVDLPEAGCVLGEPYPDWPEQLTTFAERKIYQLGVAHGKAVQRHEDALLIAQLQAQLKEVSEGLDIVERNLAVAQNADPAEAPFPLMGQEAVLWHKASAAAYQHALEMCNSQLLKAFVDNGFNPVPEVGTPVLKVKKPAKGASKLSM